MKTNNIISHNDLTLIKYASVYYYYKDLCKRNKAQYPEVANYIARSYYYNIIGKKFQLTPNYVCSIICRIVNNEEQFEENLKKAKMNIESDGEIF